MSVITFHFSKFQCSVWSLPENLFFDKNLQEADDNLLTAKQIESLVFTVVGVAIAFLLTASLLFGICQCAVTTRYTNVPITENPEILKNRNYCTNVSSDLRSIH